MLSAGIQALRALQSAGAVMTRGVTGKLIRVSRAGGNIIKIRGVREYADGRASEFEELRLARLFHRYLKLYIREKLLKIPSNRLFTISEKGRDHPLAWTGAMLDNFVYIRKMAIGYRVGFNTSARYNKDLTLGQLLNILEKGTRLDRTEEAERKIRAFIWANIKNKKMVNPTKEKPGYFIPPRPFFDTIVTKFTTHNRGERREFTKGYYALSIVVRKPKIRRYATSEPVKERKTFFTELYG